jgi:Mg-chelatase subunit ChlD
VEKGWTRDYKSDEYVAKPNPFARTTATASASATAQSVSKPVTIRSPNIVQLSNQLTDAPIKDSSFAAKLSPPPATLPGQATISQDADGRGLVIQADDDTFDQISKVVSNLDKPLDLTGKGKGANYLALSATNQWAGSSGASVVTNSLFLSDSGASSDLQQKLTLNQDFAAKQEELNKLIASRNALAHESFQENGGKETRRTPMANVINGNLAAQDQKIANAAAELKRIASGVGINLEYFGYDDPGPFVPQAVAAGSGGANLSVSATLPLTHYRVREMASMDAELTRNAGIAQAQAANAATNGTIVQPMEADNSLTLKQPASPPLEPQPEVLTSDNAFSTFSLNVSDVSFKLAAASLEKGLMPDPGSNRSEEFINAFDYRDPEPAPGAPLAFAWERSQYPFAQNRDLVRFAVKTAAAGRQPGRPLNIVLLLDNSGSMERADRVAIIREALRVLATELQTQDTLSVVTFARTARLFVDGVPGNQAANVAEQVSGLTPEGGTNLEEAMRLAYETARRHYLAGGINRVVLLTDGAANLGNVDPAALKAKVEENRKQGIALDCFGIGWEGYNDDLLEVLSRNGDGRYGFLNTPEEAATDFAGQLAGALHVAASDVKVQIEFNPRRVTAYRQIGYAKHQLTKEQFRDNTVNAAQIGAAEEGNALYTVEINPAGEGPLGTVRVRFRVPGTQDYQEHAWTLPYSGNAAPLEQATAAMRLAATASAFSEWLGQSPYAAEVTPDQLLGYLRGVPQIYGADARPTKLEWMIRQAKSLTGK